MVLCIHRRLLWLKETWVPQQSEQGLLVMEQSIQQVRDAASPAAAPAAILLLMQAPTCNDSRLHSSFVMTMS